eukprot:TRINITY_DN2143_c0_g1_i1.p1 TRINITY_DN2143_c0_g1~~TRINITY_DN2143_c0_g1_i1.p1  ORF type:complete len:450 (+),score=80.35 TRINITY_DN2143_c0_g1_i1:740-2089(+)
MQWNQILNILPCSSDLCWIIVDLICSDDHPFRHLSSCLRVSKRWHQQLDQEGVYARALEGLSRNKILAQRREPGSSSKEFIKNLLQQDREKEWKLIEKDLHRFNQKQIMAAWIKLFADGKPHSCQDLIKPVHLNTGLWSRRIPFDSYLCWFPEQIEHFLPSRTTLIITLKLLGSKRKYFLRLQQTFLKHTSKLPSTEIINQIWAIAQRFSECQGAWYYAAGDAVNWYMQHITLGKYSNCVPEIIHAITASRLSSWSIIHPLDAQDASEEIKRKTLEALFDETYHASSEELQIAYPPSIDVRPTRRQVAWSASENSRLEEMISNHLPPNLKDSKSLIFTMKRIFHRQMPQIMDDVDAFIQYMREIFEDVVCNSMGEVRYPSWMGVSEKIGVLYDQLPKEHGKRKAMVSKILDLPRDEDRDVPQRSSSQKKASSRPKDQVDQDGFKIAHRR